REDATTTFSRKAMRTRRKKMSEVTRRKKMIEVTRLERLDEIELGAGAHDSREAGMNAMEAVAWIAGEPHSDTPECTCPVIAKFIRSWNDALPDEDRTRLLRPLLPALIGTRGSEEIEDRR